MNERNDNKLQHANRASWHRVTRWIRNHLIISALIAGSAFHIGTRWLIPPGICYSRLHYYTDEEMIDLALQGRLPERAKQFNAEEARAYRMMHPGCCSVVRGGHVGFGRVVTRVAYETDEILAPNSDRKYFVLELLADSCLNVHEHDGMSSDKAPRDFYGTDKQQGENQ
jgi:hypothetical protein